MAKLVVLSKGFSGQTCELKEDKVTIGRTPDNSFTIAEGSVSSRHCEVVSRAGKVYVKDLGSTNGTFIDDKKLGSETELSPGKIMRVGQVEIRLETGAGDSASKSMEKTIVLKQGGVKPGDLEQPTHSGAVGKDRPFVKKSNRVHAIFIGLGILLAVAIVALLIFALVQLT